jgi:acylphosphatase
MAGRFKAQAGCDKIRAVNARAHVFVSGRVQGVFYRGYTERWARSLGLAGWVRNLFDGRVEVLVEGDKIRIEELLERLKAGPSRARVDQVSVDWGEAGGEFEGFSVRATDF